ncbi:MAG TPA: hypothetical protein VGO30_11955 [Mycobacterium sp.]|jgi:hypothetical protein|nr:hypothetical protein [Mycobacterium sp.]
MPRLCQHVGQALVAAVETGAWPNRTPSSRPKVDGNGQFRRNDIHGRDDRGTPRRLSWRALAPIIARNGGGAILDAVGAGAFEVLADDVSRAMQAGLSAGVPGLYPQFAR